MSLYCLQCRKNTESKNPKTVKTKQGRIMLPSKCVVWNSEKSRFIKEQETMDYWSSLGIKMKILSKIHILIADVK